jgi:hypothetical protein
MFCIIYCAIFAKRGIDLILSHGDNSQISVIGADCVPLLAQAEHELEK